MIALVWELNGNEELRRKEREAPDDPDPDLINKEEALLFLTRDTLQSFEQAVTWDVSPSGPAQRAECRHECRLTETCHGVRAWTRSWLKEL